MHPLPELWLRGPMPGVYPAIAPALFALQQAREDIAGHSEGLTTDQIWATPHGFGSVGFHLRHIAGSIDRLVTYLEGNSLSEEQLATLAAEHNPGATRDELIANADAAFRRAELVFRATDPTRLTESRTVGRKHLPTTVIGLVVHIAEHTQRHVGQLISAAKLARV